MNGGKLLRNSESLRLVTGEFGGLQVLSCPKCGLEYLHIIKVDVYRKRDKITIKSEEISIADDENTTRGSIISIEYACEEGHHGLIIFHFYKGNVETRHKPLPELSGAYEDLFRD